MAAVDVSKPYIEFDIFKDGKTEMTVKGASGPSCLAMTAPFEQALGGEIDRKLLPEYEQAAVQQQVTNAAQ